MEGGVTESYSEWVALQETEISIEYSKNHSAPSY